MNCVMPKAPLQEPTKLSAGTTPSRSRRTRRKRSFPQRLVPGGAREPGVQHIGLADLAAVVGLDAEDGDQRGRIDLVLLADGVQLRADLLHHHLAVGHALVVDRLGDVVPPALAAFGLALAEDTVVGSSLAPAVYLSQSASVRPLAVAPLRSLSRQALVSSAVGMMTTGSAAAGAAVAAGTAVGAGAGAGAAVRGGREPVPAGVADSGAAAGAGVRRQRAGSGRRRGFGRGRGGGRGGRQRRVVEAALGVSAGAAGAGVCAREPVAEAGWACAAPAAAVNAAASRIWGKASIRNEWSARTWHSKNRTQPRSYRVPMMKSNRRWLSGGSRRRPEEAGAARAGTAPATRLNSAKLAD